MNKPVLTIVDTLITEFKFNGGHRSNLDYEFFENFQSEHTKKAYEADLKQFFTFIHENIGRLKSIEEIERIHVIAFRNDLQNNNNAPKTVIRKLAAINSYCEFLMEKGLLNINPATGVKRPRDEVITPTNDLTDAQVKLVIDAVKTDSLTGHLHKSILSLMFATGLRKSELIHLKLSDYTEQDGFKVIQFMGKRGKMNHVPLHPTAAYHLDRYILEMKSESRLTSPDEWLFQPTRNNTDPHHLNKNLMPASVDFIIKKYCHMVGIETRISPHSARATMISSLLEHGCDLYRVSQLVNHSNVKTTQGYDKRDRKISDSPVFGLKFF